MFVASSPGAFPRLGVVVPKHRHGSVERNLVKRRLREIGRRTILPRLREAELPLDLLLRARAEAYGADWEELRAELLTLTEALCSRGG